MASKNFYIQAHLDGQLTPLQGGPRAEKSYGFSLMVKALKEGEIFIPLTVEGVSDVIKDVLKVKVTLFHPDGSEEEKEVSFRRSPKAGDKGKAEVGGEVPIE